MKVLVGNKRDLSKGEGVESAIETTCDLYCLPYLETSAKLDSNLDKVMQSTFLAPTTAGKRSYIVPILVV